MFSGLYPPRLGLHAVTNVEMSRAGSIEILKQSQWMSDRSGWSNCPGIIECRIGTYLMDLYNTI